MSTELTNVISHVGAKQALAQPLESEEQARDLAELLGRAGYKVLWRVPHSEFGTGSGIWILASVHDPITDLSPGDVMYRRPTGVGPGLHPPARPRPTAETTTE